VGLLPYEPDLLHGLLVDVALLCGILSNDEELAQRGQQLFRQFPVQKKGLSRATAPISRSPFFLS
jgi:hypothetical protein